LAEMESAPYCFHIGPDLFGVNCVFRFQNVHTSPKGRLSNLAMCTTVNDVSKNFITSRWRTFVGSTLSLLDRYSKRFKITTGCSSTSAQSEYIKTIQSARLERVVQFNVQLYCVALTLWRNGIARKTVCDLNTGISNNNDKSRS
jgi:hypothetical protein